MRILFLTSALDQAGTFVRALRLSFALGKQGHEVALFKIAKASRLKSEVNEVDGVRIIGSPRFWGMRWFGNDALPSDIAFRVWYLLKEPYTVVHMFSHHLNNFLPGIIGRKVARVRLLISDWDDLWTDGGWYGTSEMPKIPRLRYRLQEWLEQRARQLADGVTVIGDALGDKTRMLGIPQDRILKLPISIDTKAIRPIPMEEARSRLGISFKGTILVYVGSALPDSDALTLLDALSLLLERRDNIRLLVVGRATEQLTKIAASRGLSAWLIPVGFIPDDLKLCYYLCAADVALLPYGENTTNQFRFPTKLADYLSAGRPVVIQTGGEPAEFVKRHQVGLISGNPSDAFARAIEQLVKDDTLRLTCAKNARKVAEIELDVQRQASKLVNFYMDLLNSA